MRFFPPHFGHWAGLACLSFFIAAVLHWVGLPAALLLGPMVGAVCFALRGAPLDVPRWAFHLAQAVLGCMVARAVNASLVATILQQWPAMLGVIGTILLSGVCVGFLLIRFGSLPGSTAAWGSTPGGAAVMTSLAETFGADVRLVAFMQYLRLFIVVLTASGVSHLLLGHSAALPGQGTWTLGFDAPWLPVFKTLLVIIVGALGARKLRFPSAPLLIPMLLGATLNTTGMVELTLPMWLICCAYCALGWFIGLRFTGPIVRYALRAVPQMLAAIVLLILLCCFAAWLLTALMGVDGLTAYLATSPGGLDTVIAIALGSHCDIPFVLAFQTFRLFTVVLLGPVAARYLCRYADARNAKNDMSNV